MRFLCKVSSNMKFTRFQQTTALQHCKLSLADVSPPYRFTDATERVPPSLTCSFHLQFHDLRLFSGHGNVKEAHDEIPVPAKNLLESHARLWIEISCHVICPCAPFKGITPRRKAGVFYHI